MVDLDNTLEWNRPMTSEQAKHYHLTKGFVAAELFDAELGKMVDRVLRLERKLTEVHQEAFCAKEYLDSARGWLKQIMAEIESSPQSADEWRDGLCSGSPEVAINYCKAALSDIPEGGDVPFMVRKRIEAERKANAT